MAASAAPSVEGQFIESTAEFPIFTNPQKGKVGVSCPNGNIIDVNPGDYIIGKHFAEQARQAMGKGLRMASGAVPKSRLKDPLRILEQIAESGEVVERDIRGIPVFRGKQIDHWRKYFASVGDEQLRQDFDKKALKEFFAYAQVALPLAPEGSSEPTREALVTAVRAWAKS